MSPSAAFLAWSATPDAPASAWAAAFLPEAWTRSASFCAVALASAPTFLALLEALSEADSALARAPSAVALVVAFAASAVVLSSPEATLWVSRTLPSVPCTTTLPPPSFDTISVARSTASACVAALALARWAPFFCTCQPSSVGTTYRSAMTVSTPV